MRYLTAICLMFMMVFMFGTTASASLIGNKGVQVNEYVYDFAVQGGAVGYIDISAKLANNLPVGANVLRINYYVQTAFLSPGSGTVAIGDSGSNARYKAAAGFDDAAYAVNNIAVIASGVPNYIATAAEGKVGITVASSDLTAGKVSFFVEYVQNKR